VSASPREARSTTVVRENKLAAHTRGTPGHEVRSSLMTPHGDLGFGMPMRPGGLRCGIDQLVHHRARWRVGSELSALAQEINVRAMPIIHFGNHCTWASLHLKTHRAQQCGRPSVA